MENRKEAFEGECLGTEQMAGDFSMFGGPAAGKRCTAALFAAAGGKRRFAEKEGVVTGRGVGGEVGG